MSKTRMKRSALSATILLLCLLIVTGVWGVSAENNPIHLTPTLSPTATPSPTPVSSQSQEFAGIFPLMIEPAAPYYVGDEITLSVDPPSYTNVTLRINGEREQFQFSSGGSVDFVVDDLEVGDHVIQIHLSEDVIPGRYWTTDPVTITVAPRPYATVELGYAPNMLIVGDEFTVTVEANHFDTVSSTVQTYDETMLTLLGQSADPQTGRTQYHFRAEAAGDTSINVHTIGDPLSGTPNEWLRTTYIRITEERVPFHLYEPFSDTIWGMNVYGWAFSWQAPVECDGFARIFTPQGDVLESAADQIGEPYFSHSRWGAGNVGGFLSYPWRISDSTTGWSWQLVLDCPDGTSGTEVRPLWVSKNESYPYIAPDQIGVRVISGTVGTDDGSGGMVSTAGVTVTCQNVSASIDGCFPQSMVTDEDGAFSFELVAHESDEITISAHTDSLATQSLIPPADCLEQCPTMTLLLAEQIPTHVQSVQTAGQTPSNTPLLFLLLTVLSFSTLRTVRNDASHMRSSS